MSKITIHADPVSDPQVVAGFYNELVRALDVPSGAMPDVDLIATTNGAAMGAAQQRPWPVLEKVQGGTG